MEILEYICPIDNTKTKCEIANKATSEIKKDIANLAYLFLIIFTVFVLINFIENN